MKKAHPERVPEYLQHIVEAIDRACGYVAGMDPAAFEKDIRTQDAVMRNRVIHDYFEVDLEVVWQTIQRDLPLLRPRFRAHSGT